MFYGGNDDDTLLLVAALTDPVFFDGDYGDDTADGGSGKDRLLGGPGVDDIRGRGGNDFIDGGDGGQTGLKELHGGAGNDVILGGTGSDKIHGGDDNDCIDGRDNSDFIEGDDGGDVIFGGPGSDFLYGDVNVTPSPVPGGSDEIWGEAGADTIKGGPAGDIIWSGVAAPDQPYNGVLPPGGIPGSPDILGSGENLGGCDTEDGHPDTDPGCPPGGGGGPMAAADAYVDNQLHYIEDIGAGILANDSGGDLTAELVTDVQFGSLSLNLDGTFAYTPSSDFYGVDYFQYLATDGTNDSNVTTVVLNVEPPAVGAVDDNYLSTSGQPIEDNVLANDEQADGAFYVDGSGPSAGSLAFNFDGSFTFIPPEGDGRANAPYLVLSGPCCLKWLCRQSSPGELDMRSSPKMWCEHRLAVAIEGAFALKATGM